MALLGVAANSSNIYNTIGLGLFFGLGAVMFSILFYGFIVSKFIKGMMVRCQGVRRLGAAAIDLAYVACGRFDAFWEFNLKPWDVAAGILIVEEAGGKISDFKGLNAILDSPFQILASNGKVHSQIVTAFRPILKLTKK